jgi:2-aminoethylphosphonate transport system permease protein
LGPPSLGLAALGLPPARVAAPLLLLAVGFLYPLALILAESLGIEAGRLTFAHYRAVLATDLFRNALLHTLGIALAATFGCLVLGFAIALVLAFVPFPGGRAVGRMIDTIVAFPSFLVALSLTFLYGSAGILNNALMVALRAKLPPVAFLYTWRGVGLGEITVYAPFVMRPLLAAFATIDRAQIDVAASLGARPFRVLRTIILPAALPGLLAGGSLCLLLTVNEFGVVFFIGAKGVIALPLLTYDKAVQEFDDASATVIAIVNIALSFGLFVLYRTALARLRSERPAVA